MIKKDRIFDGLTQRFQRKVYGDDDPRGKIRLYIAQNDLMEQIPMHPAARILDAGGGMGQMSVWLAQQGHHVVLAEPSTEMLSAARTLITAAGLETQIQLQTTTIQSLAQTESVPYTGIIMHAVLEWLANPYTTLQQLLTVLAPGGWLSLMFFNQYSKEMRHLLAGDFAPILQGHIASDGQNGLAPISPLPPDEVLSWLPALGLELVSWSGVRCFYDYSHPEVRKRMALDELLQLERHYSQREPWRSLARYQHLICRKTS